MFSVSLSNNKAVQLLVIRQAGRTQFMEEWDKRGTARVYGSVLGGAKSWNLLNAENLEYINASLVRCRISCYKNSCTMQTSLAKPIARLALRQNGRLIYVLALIVFQELSFLLVLALLRGFFSWNSGIPPCWKTSISKFQFGLERGPAWKPAYIGLMWLSLLIF